MKINLPAHCLDDEFEEQCAAAGIAIIDRSQEPWSVIFEGERDALLNFVGEHWGEYTSAEIVLLVDSSEVK